MDIIIRIVDFFCTLWNNTIDYAKSSTIEFIELCILVVTIVGLLWEIHHSRKSTGYSTYLDTSKAFIDSSMALIEHPPLRNIYSFDANYKNSSSEAQQMSAYCDSLIMIFENVWDCYKRGFFKKYFFSKKDDGTWCDWYCSFEELLLRSDDFILSWKWSLGYFSSPFEKIGNNILLHSAFFIEVNKTLPDPLVRFPFTNDNMYKKIWSLKMEITKSNNENKRKRLLIKLGQLVNLDFKKNYQKLIKKSLDKLKNIG